MKFTLIEAEKAEFPIRFMCDQLSVSRSGYYAWQGRSPSNRAVETAQLGAEVQAIYSENKGRYGSPRIARELGAQGRCTSRNRVARIMQAGEKGDRLDLDVRIKMTSRTYEAKTGPVPIFSFFLLSSTASPTPS